MSSEVSPGNESGAAAVPRVSCPILRTHQRYLLRDLQCIEQYAPIYRCRLEQQHGRVLQSLKDELHGRHRRRPQEYPHLHPCDERATEKNEEDEGEEHKPPNPLPPHLLKEDLQTGLPRASRIIDLRVREPAIVVGVTYKTMKRLPQFLKEYQKELLRLDAGDAGSSGDDEAPVALEDEAEEVLSPISPTAELTTGEGDEENPYVCSPNDELALEDSSGRVVLQGREMTPGFFCTGLVMAVCGVLEADGNFWVWEYALSGMDDLYTSPPRHVAPPSPSSSEEAGPCYIAFLSGLSMEVEPEPQRVLQLSLLLDFLSGNAGSPSLQEMARRISRVIIGGNHITLTEEIKLKKKVKLEPPDHVRLKANTRDVFCASAMLMTKRVDAFLAQLCRTVEVELLPGDRDTSNAYMPQQPLHPILLPQASQYSTLRLVTNPFEFTALPPQVDDDGEPTRPKAEEEEEKKQREKGLAAVRDGIHFFVSSGQNINDMARQTSFSSRLQVLELMVEAGCACPTAPNTLWSYPFPDSDPFLLPRCPHCVVVCEQPAFETSWKSLNKTTGSVNGSSNKDEEEKEEEEMSGRGGAGIRLVCVPSFQQTGKVVLVDLHSPTLATVSIDFSLHSQLKREI